MKILAIMFTLFLTLNISAQFKISDIYIGGGYHDSKLNDLNSFLNLYPESSTIHFNKVDGFSHIDLGIITTFCGIKRFSIDIGIDYYFPLSREIDFVTFKEYDGPTYDDITSGEILAFRDTVVYPYGFKLQSYKISVLPSYKLIDYKWFSLDVGLGLVFYHTFLRQKGINVNATPTLWTTEAVSMSTNDFSFGWLGSINLCFRLNDHFYIDTQIKYQAGIVKNMAADYPSWYDPIDSNSNKVLYPITNVDIDFTGINYILRLRYKI